MACAQLHDCSINRRTLRVEQQSKAKRYGPRAPLFAAVLMLSLLYFRQSPRRGPLEEFRHRLHSIRLSAVHVGHGHHHACCGRTVAAGL